MVSIHPRGIILCGESIKASILILCLRMIWGGCGCLVVKALDKGAVSIHVLFDNVI